MKETIIILVLTMSSLIYQGQVTHIYVSKITIIGSDNDMSPGRRQAIIWINAGILLIGPLGTNFSDILIKIYIFSFKKMHLKMSGDWEPFCFDINVLKKLGWIEVSPFVDNIFILISFDIYVRIFIKIWIQYFPGHLNDNKSALVEEMVWCHQATSDCIIYDVIWHHQATMS